MGTRARTVPQNCWVSVPWAAARCLAPRAPCVTILTQIGNHLIVQATPQQDDCLCRIVWRNRVSFSVPAARLRALAVTTATRSEVLPDIPAVSELVPGYEASNWYGVGVPKNTPVEIVEKLNREIKAAL